MTIETRLKLFQHRVDEAIKEAIEEILYDYANEYIDHVYNTTFLTNIIRYKKDYKEHYDELLQQLAAMELELHLIKTPTIWQRIKTELESRFGILFTVNYS